MRAEVLLVALMAMASGATAKTEKLGEFVPQSCLKALAHCNKYFVATVTPPPTTITVTCTGRRGRPSLGPPVAKTLEPRGPEQKKQKPFRFHTACGGYRPFSQACALIGVTASTVTCSSTPTITITVGPANITQKSTRVTTVTKIATPTGFVLRVANIPNAPYIRATSMADGRPCFTITNKHYKATVFNLLEGGILTSKFGKLGTTQGVKGSFIGYNQPGKTALTCTINKESWFTCQSKIHREFGTYVNKDGIPYIFMGVPKVNWKDFNGQKLALAAIPVY
ncbi:hypothetical protein DRE_00714 [Drechslerella stenobrocha 248]|uniref:Uncharacterized protein n=1 Tax=Drechslerella stenobrocha 248 TaxID=1043628 RepID=W7I8G5_9PEZI|nr:hypothetical protein DRE_00714 [Drechslerella stenobrocha 248]